MSGNLFQGPAGAQFPGVVDGRFQAQHVFAFGVGLGLEQPEVDLEPGEAVPRSLDHDADLGGVVDAVVVGPRFGAEQSPHSRHVQAGPGPVDDGVEDLLHLGPVAEQQVAGVLGLIYREAVAESRRALFVGVQTEAQARAVDPAFARLAQSPYSRVLRQGHCDLRQAGRVGHLGEAVALLAEAYPGGVRGDRDVLVPVEDDLGAERRVPGHLDGQVSPDRVHDVERVVVHERRLLLQIADHPGR